MIRILFFLLLNAALIYSQSYDLKTAIDNYKAGKYKEAAAVFEKHISSGSTEKDVYLAAADCHIKLNEFNKAITVLDKYRKLYGDDYNTLFTLAQLHAHNADFTLAINILTNLYKSYPDSASVKQLLSDVYLSAGAADFGRQDSISAEINFKNSLAFAPFNRQARINLLIVLVGSKKYGAALPYAADGYRFFKNDNTFELFYFETLTGLEKFAEALPVLESIAAKQQDDLKIQLNLALLYRLNNLPEKASELYEKLRIKHPGNREIFDAEVAFYELFSDDEKVIELSKNYLDFKPDDRAVSLRLAKMYEKTGAFDKARDIFRSLDTETGDNLMSLLIAENYFMEGNTAEAINQLKAVIESRNADPAVFMRLYEFMVKNGDSLSAGEIINSGLIIFPSSAELNLESAKIYYRAGKADSSLIRLEKIRGFSGEIPEIPYYFALIYKGLNEKNKAVQNFTRAIRTAIRSTSELQTSLSTSFTGEALSNPDSAAAIRKKSEKFDLYKEIVISGFSELTQICTENELIDIINNLLSELPEAALLYLEKGNVYLRSGKTELALTEYEKAQILSPSTMEVQQTLAAFYEKTGEPEKALDYYRRAGGLDKENPLYYRKIIDLAVLTGKLGEICDYWLQIFKTTKDIPILKEFLIEALHKAGRTKDALEVIRTK